MKGERETLRSGYNWQANTKTAAVQWISLCVMSIMCSSVLILENMLSWQMSNEEEKPGNKKAQRSDASFFPRWLLSGTSSYFQETCVCLFPLLKKADDYGAQIGVPGSVSNWDSSSTLLLMMMMAASFTILERLYIRSAHNAPSLWSCIHLILEGHLLLLFLRVLSLAPTATRLIPSHMHPSRQLTKKLWALALSALASLTLYL